MMMSLANRNVAHIGRLDVARSAFVLRNLALPLHSPRQERADERRANGAAPVELQPVRKITHLVPGLAPLSQERQGRLRSGQREGRPAGASGRAAVLRDREHQATGYGHVALAELKPGARQVLRRAGRAEAAHLPLLHCPGGLARRLAHSPARGRCGPREAARCPTGAPARSSGFRIDDRKNVCIMFA